MASTTIVRKPPRFAQLDDSQNEIVAVSIDVARTETHTLDSDVTDHPVEQGPDISDHSRPKPDRVTMECLVSNSPISSAQQTTADQSGSVGFDVTAGGPTPRGSPGRAEAAYAQLKAWRDAGAALTVVTNLTTYDTMAIESISIPQSSAISDAILFTIAIKKIRIVKNKLTRTVVAKTPAAQPKSSKGNQTTTPDVGQNESALHSLFGG